MADREALYLPAAKEAFENASAHDQQQFDRIVRNLCLDPWIDPPVKMKFDVPPVVISLYDDSNYWVVYHLPDNVTLLIWMIGKAPRPPRPR